MSKGNWGPHLGYAPAAGFHVLPKELLKYKMGSDIHCIVHRVMTKKVVGLYSNNFLFYPGVLSNKLP
jgi:hypothetical protein